MDIQCSNGLLGPWVIFERLNILLPRTDFLNQHINGQGNFGFCSPGCTAQPALPDTVSRSKFEVAAGADTPVNLPDSGE